MKAIELIEKRIKELQRFRDTLSQEGNARTKYNFIIGELQNVIVDLKNAS